MYPHLGWKMCLYVYASVLQLPNPAYQKWTPVKKPLSTLVKLQERNERYFISIDGKRLTWLVNWLTAELQKREG